MDQEEVGGSLAECKVIYFAPTKALCSEKATSWQEKFSLIGLKCKQCRQFPARLRLSKRLILYQSDTLLLGSELTGDTMEFSTKVLNEANIV